MKTNSVSGYNLSYASPNFKMARVIKFVGFFNPEVCKADNECLQALHNSVQIDKLTQKYNFIEVLDDTFEMFDVNRRCSSLTLKSMSEISRRCYNYKNKIMHKYNPEKYPLEQIEKKKKLPKKIYIEAHGTDKLKTEIENIDLSGI